jgi:hypothetical protein
MELVFQKVSDGDTLLESSPVIFDWDRTGKVIPESEGQIYSISLYQMRKFFYEVSKNS